MSDSKAITSGIHHLGLTVPDLDATCRFFADALGFDVIADGEALGGPYLTAGDLRAAGFEVFRRPRL